MTTTSPQPDNQRARYRGIPHSADPLVGVAARIASAVRWLIRRLTVLAIVSLAAALVVCITVWDRITDPGSVDQVIVLILALALAAPGALLLFYAFALRALLRLPARIRDSLGDATRTGSDLYHVASELRARPGLGGAWTTVRVINRARSDLIVYVPSIRALSPAVGLLALAAVPAAFFVILLAILSGGIWLITR